MLPGVIGNTLGSEPSKSRFEPWGSSASHGWPRVTELPPTLCRTHHCLLTPAKGRAYGNRLGGRASRCLGSAPCHVSWGAQQRPVTGIKAWWSNGYLTSFSRRGLRVRIPSRLREACCKVQPVAVTHLSLDTPGSIPGSRTLKGARCHTRQREVPQNHALPSRLL